MFVTANLGFFLAFFIATVSCGCLDSCPQSSKLNALPGLGWDALTNRDTKPVLKFTYNNCNLTDDGKYIIPDNTFITTFREKYIEAEVINHWMNYTAPTGKALHPGYKNMYWPLYHSLSGEYQQMKYLLVANRTILSRIQLRQKIYNVEMTNTEIADPLKQQLMLFIRAIEAKQIENASEIAESILKEFGTHYMTSAVIGAALVREDYLRSELLIEHPDRRSTIASIGKYLVLYNMGISRNESLDQSLIDEYKATLIKRKTKFHGQLNWENDLDVENWVVVDRQGVYLSNLLVDANFTNVPKLILIQAREILEDTIRLYFKKNSHHGCTLPDSTNFDFSKNIDDGSCSQPITSFLFGGVYDSCVQSAYFPNSSPCAPFNIRNPLTNANSCPTGFTTNVIQTLSDNTKIVNFFSCQSTGSYRAPYLFGGIFSSTVANIHTKNQSCPPSYTAIPFMINKLQMCVNTNINDHFAWQFALSFGGFASISTEFLCPHGYERHLAVSFSGVASVSNPGNIYYCLRKAHIKNLGVVVNLSRPPYPVEKSPCDLDTCYCKAT